MNKNILLLLLFILLIGGFSFVNYSKTSKIQNSQRLETSPVSGNEKPTNTPTVTKSNSQTNNWQKHSNAQFGYEISYPSNYKMMYDQDGVLSLKSDTDDTLIFEITKQNPKDVSGKVITDLTQTYTYIKNEENLNIQGIKALKDWHTARPTKEYPEGDQKVITLRFLKDSRFWMITAVVPVDDTQAEADVQDIMTSLRFTK